MALSKEVYRPLSVWERFPVLNEIPKEHFPAHVVIVPDGNRRYAREKGQNPIQGHVEGAKVVKQILGDLRELPIDYVTFWAFSSDNYKRSPEEVNGLMMLLAQMVSDNVDELSKNKSRFIHIGSKERISPELRDTLIKAEELTKHNTGQTLCLAIDYSLKSEIVDIMKKIKDPSFNTPITKQLIDTLKYGGAQIPQADLFIRTSEQRTSGFGLLIGEKTEFHFIKDKLFPQIGTEDIVNAVIDFSQRQRRFGK